MIIEKNHFLNFRLVVGPIVGDYSERYIAAVVEAPVNRNFVSFFDLGPIDQLQTKIPIVRSRKGEWRISDDYNFENVKHMSNMPNLKAIGNSLFRYLFPYGSLHLQLLSRSCASINPLQNVYLRLQLELHPNLANIPWELAECPNDDPHAADIKAARISITRYLGDINQRAEDNVKNTHVNNPAVIIVKADPEGYSNKEISNSLNCERERIKGILEQQSIDYRIVSADEKRTYENYAGTFIELIRAIDDLEKNEKTIVGLHMIGHGGIDEEGSFFVGETSEYKPHFLYSDDVRNALDRTRSIRWAIINACNCGGHPVGVPLSGLATSIAILKHVPTVIAYTRPVETHFAENLAAEFYQAVLAKKRSISETFRDVQRRHNTINGMVLLQSSINGKIEESIIFNQISPQKSDAQEEPSSATECGTPETVREEKPQPQQPAKANQRSPKNRLDEMVLVKEGVFQKGLTKEKVDFLIKQFRKLPINVESFRKALEEEPLQHVDLKSFYIDKYPVTNKQFDIFVKETGYRTTAEDTSDRENWRTIYTRDKEKHPVVCVSFLDVKAYAAWCGKRIPTAEEWQKAFRGTEGHLYPWGDNYDAKFCNTAESCRGLQTTEVNRFPEGVSPYGCYDMVGNVEEWTSTEDERGNRMIFGGSWEMTCQVYGLPVLNRLASDTFYSRDLGFRCVCD